MRRWLLAALACLLAGASSLAWLAAGLWVPADSQGADSVFRIGPGDTLRVVADRLHDERLITLSPSILVYWGRATGAERSIKSGEYDLGPRMTPAEILQKLVSGNVKTHAVTLPEGIRLDEVAARLERAQIAEATDFLEHARRPEVARALGIEADSCEGYVYPETYRFRRPTPPGEILERTLSEFTSRLTAQDRAKIQEMGRTLHEIVTLASIVEKETAVDEERALIAAVFWNRLQKRMRLQSDPTVIYGLIETQGSFDGDIRSRDLRADNPYNTYTRHGLPPGPIANTTIESIRAVLEPADVPYLYFVSRNDGTHEFSITLADHTRAVKRYQNRRKPGG